MHTRERDRILRDPLHRCGDGFGEKLTQAWLSAGIPALGFDQVLQRLRQEADRPLQPSPSCPRTCSQGMAAVGFCR